MARRFAVVCLFGLLFIWCKVHLQELEVFLLNFLHEQFQRNQLTANTPTDVYWEQIPQQSVFTAFYKFKGFGCGGFKTLFHSRNFAPAHPVSQNYCVSRSFWERAGKQQRYFCKAKCCACGLTERIRTSKGRRCEKVPNGNSEVLFTYGFIFQTAKLNLPISQLRAGKNQEQPFRRRSHVVSVMHSVMSFCCACICIYIYIYIYNALFLPWR